MSARCLEKQISQQDDKYTYIELAGEIDNKMYPIVFIFSAYLLEEHWYKIVDLRSL